MVTEAKKIEAITSAYQEFYVKGKVETKCPQCGKQITIKAFGNSSEMKCPCGFMDGTARGI